MAAMLSYLGGDTKAPPSRCEDNGGDDRAPLRANGGNAQALLSYFGSDTQAPPSRYEGNGDDAQAPQSR